MNTLNLEIFERVLFLHTSQMQSFMQIKNLGNGEITLSFTDVGKSLSSHDFVTQEICF